MIETETQVIVAKSATEMEQRINQVTQGRKLINISTSTIRDGDGLAYTTTVVLEKINGTKQYLVEG